MHEVELVPRGDAFEERVAAHDADRVPPHVRHLERRVREGETTHLPRDEAERDLVVFLRAIEGKLQAEADPEHGRPAGHRFRQRTVQVPGPQAAHRATGRAHAGEDDAFRSPHPLGVIRDLGAYAHLRARPLDAAQIAGVVVDDDGHRGLPASG